MDAITAPGMLSSAIDRHCVRVAKPKHSILFNRGDDAFGVFLVLSGLVVLDVGTSGTKTITSPCGPGALIGVPATLSKTSYSMTARVVRDATLGFLSTKRFFALLEDHRQLSLDVLTPLSQKMETLQQAQKATFSFVM